jgi:hypothetical protein
VADGECRMYYIEKEIGSLSGIFYYYFYSYLFDSVPKAGVCTGGAPNAPVRLQDCCKSLSFHIIIPPHIFLLRLKKLFSNFILQP